MSDCVMETICTNCKNRRICKYVNEVSGMYSLIDDIKPTRDKPYKISIECNERKVFSRSSLPSSEEIAKGMGDWFSSKGVELRSTILMDRTED